MVRTRSCRGRCRPGLARGDADPQLPLQTAAQSVVPLCRKHDVGMVAMMPLNQASKTSGLVSAKRRWSASADMWPRESAGRAALHRAGSGLPEALLGPAAVRYVLSHDITTFCVGVRSIERLQENLKTIDPPYLDEGRLTRLRELFGRIEWQVR